MNSKTVGVGAAFVIGVFALAGCAAGAATIPSTPASTEATSASATPTPTATATATSTPSATSSTSPSSTGTSGAPTSTVATEKAGKPLALADFFMADRAWKENRFNVADKSGISGIGAEIDTYYETDAVTLELRLANNFDELSFKVGQSNESLSSDQTLVVKVIGNGKQIDVQKVPFNTITPVAVNVKDVNALKIQVFLDEKSPRDYDPAVAVISEVTAE